jgi:hypothetical protein
MTTGSTQYQQPVKRDENREGLDTVEYADGTRSEIWHEVQAVVQQVFAELDDAVRARVPDLEVDAGKTHGRHFCLFAYRTFSRTGRPIDPVVAGLTFVESREENGNHVAIDADISGEETGDCLVSLPRRTIPLVPEQLVRAARDTAIQLARNADRIANALLDPSRAIA